MLFDYWVKIYYKKSHKTIISNLNEYQNTDILLKLTNFYKIKFITWLLFSFNCLSQKSLKIQKDIDFYNIFNRKSKKHQKIDNLRGLSLSVRTTNRNLSERYDNQFQNNQKLFSNPSNVIWIDNYSKFYKLSQPRYNHFFIF